MPHDTRSAHATGTGPAEHRAVQADQPPVRPGAMRPGSGNQVTVIDETPASSSSRHHETRAVTTFTPHCPPGMPGRSQARTVTTFPVYTPPPARSVPANASSAVPGRPSSGAPDVVIEMAERSPRATTPPLETPNTETSFLSLPTVHTAASPTRSVASECAIPIDDPDPPEKPGYFHFRMRHEQSEKTEDVRRKALHDALSQYKEGPTGRQMGDLVNKIVEALPDGNSAATELKEAYDDLQEQLGTLDTAFKDFLSLRIKQKRSRVPALCDARTLFLGNSLMALALRAALQSALVAVSGSMVQYATFKILEKIVAGSMEAIPQDIIDQASRAGESAAAAVGLSPDQIREFLAASPREELSKLAELSEAQMEVLAGRIADTATEGVHKSISDLTPEQLDLARTQFSKPASSILDVDTSSNGLIYGTEAAYTFGTSSLGLSVYNLWEKAYQDEAFKESLNFGSKAPTASERIMAEARKSGLRHIVTGSAGFLIGAVANGTGKAAIGTPIGDVFKDTGAMALSQTMTSASAVSVDMVLAGALPKEQYNDYCREAAKVALRTMCAVASQYAKTEIYARFNDRSALGIGDHVRSLMTGGLGGLSKEALKAVANLLASKQAPADLDYTQKAVDTVNAFTTLMRTLNDKSLTDALSDNPLEQDRASLFSNLKTIVHPLREAETLKPDSYGIKQDWARFDDFLQEEMRRRDGPGPHNV